MKLQDLLKDLELGKVYTDKNRKPFKVNEEQITESLKGKYVVASIYGDLYTPKALPEKQALKMMMKMAKQYAGDNVFILGAEYWNKPHKFNKKKIMVKEAVLEEDFGMSATQMQPFSSKEAKAVLDSSVKEYAKLLRKAQYKIVKDWMSKAKAGVIDYYDIVRGLKTGDASRAHTYETDFLFKVLNKDKIVQRFNKYFGGKKSMNQRLVKKHKRK